MQSYSLSSTQIRVSFDYRAAQAVVANGRLIAPVLQFGGSRRIQATLYRIFLVCQRQRNIMFSVVSYRFASCTYVVNLFR